MSDKSGNLEQPQVHACSIDELMQDLAASHHGLSPEEAASRISRYGHNVLPESKPASVFTVLLRQFLSPLIYILLLAALVSLLLREWADAIFIFTVLLINSIIGAIQECSAERSASALQSLVTITTRVERDGDTYEIDAAELVPGDIVLLESGDKVPADLRLLAIHGLEVDESLLTGESTLVVKNAAAILPSDTSIGDRSNMLFAGTLVAHGRGRGVVTSTALKTELGRIAQSVISSSSVKPPLLIRMETFVVRIAYAVGFAVMLMAIAAILRGVQWQEIFFLAVALAVSAIPEGLPVALTVALAIGVNRMARRNVIVRRLVAVEALGSCTCIATDKTGTLTVNQLTARRVLCPVSVMLNVTGEGAVPEGVILDQCDRPLSGISTALQRLCYAAVLNNEGVLAKRHGDWVHHGDSVDVALLVLAHKAGITGAEAQDRYPELAFIPFEPERKYSASINRVDGRSRLHVKGAVERVLAMCSSMLVEQGEITIDVDTILIHANALAKQGYRVIALADVELESCDALELGEHHLQNLCFLGLVGMIDPLRPEAKSTIAECRKAGVEVVMVTGDHPATSLAIATELGLADQEHHLVTGADISEAQRAGLHELDRITARARVFSRVEPEQKLSIVRSLQRNGHFVAVTGDGANDAPAMHAAHVGAAMGASGTDVARETAQLIVTDDNLASLVAGIQEGRVAYGNVRKVIFLLISTGAAEIVLFLLALLSGLHLPLLAVQLLWLNLVTNGIQDVALAFEPAEGHELDRPPRSPSEAIFDRLMIERVLVSGLYMGVVAFALFWWLLQQGYEIEQARNSTLLLMVLFENIHVFNSRSETRSAFRHSPLRNPILLFGTLAAQLIHIGAMYVPGLNTVLGLAPVSPEHWLHLLVVAVTVLLVMELHKQFWCRRGVVHVGR